MAWETRSGRRYYYQKTRIGGRVVSTYTPADLLHYAELDAEIADISQRISEALAAELRALGYHQHKRQWRKRREHSES